MNTDEAEDLYRHPIDVIIPVDFDETLLTRAPSLPEDWKDYPSPPFCAALGDQWLVGGSTAILEIPQCGNFSGAHFFSKSAPQRF